MSDADKLPSSSCGVLTRSDVVTSLDGTAEQLQRLGYPFVFHHAKNTYIIILTMDDPVSACHDSSLREQADYDDMHTMRRTLPRISPMHPLRLHRLA